MPIVAALRGRRPEPRVNRAPLFRDGRSTERLVPILAEKRRRPGAA